MPLAIAVDRARIAEFCRKSRVKEFSVFGSALREDFGPKSDVDVLVELQPNHGLGLYEWVDMIEELSGIFGRKVDLVAKGGLRNPYRRREILQTAEVVYAAEGPLYGSGVRWGGWLCHRITAPPASQ